MTAIASLWCAGLSDDKWNGRLTVCQEDFELALKQLRPSIKPEELEGCGYLSMTPPESPLFPLLGAMESSSSKKMTQGAAARALANTSRIQKVS